MAYSPRDFTGGMSQALSDTFARLSAIDDERLQKERLATQDARQAALDAQNKQLFDIKMQEYNKQKQNEELEKQFEQGLLQPKYMESGIVNKAYGKGTDLYNALELTPEELAQHNKYISNPGSGQLDPKIAAKLKAQEEFGRNMADLSTNEAYLETPYEQAQRVAAQLDGSSPAIRDRMTKIQAADILAKENKLKKVDQYGKDKAGIEKDIRLVQEKLAKAEQDRNKEITGKSGGTIANGSGFKYKPMTEGDVQKVADKLGLSKDSRFFSVFGNDSVYSEGINKIADEGILTLLNSTNLNQSGKEKVLEGALATAIRKGSGDILSSDPDFDNLKSDVKKMIADLEQNKKYQSKLTPTEKVYTKQLAELEQKLRGYDNKISNSYLDKLEILAKKTRGQEAKWLDQLIPKSANSQTSTNTDTSGSNVTGRTFDGKTIIRDTSKSLTEQWNNPGAIKYADPKDKSKKWQGQIGVDNEGHAIFDTKENGVRAQLINMNNQIKKGTNLEDYVRKYAHGNQDAYIKYITDNTGIKPSDKLTQKDILKLAETQTKFEGGEFDKELFDKGYELAFGNSKSDNVKKVVDKLAPTKDNIEKIDKEMALKKAIDDAKGISLKKSVRPYISLYEAYQENVGEPFVDFINKYAPGGRR